ncbi:PREDICTED: protein transport protein Sec24A isoform X1 [Nanorana parkeri]|uniref:protein transport protein Sec24A isoform X1 n=1 Tax=Nanorana parkeri TaxID=125878 RepID=UPI0008550258|nr:PREDICTED: protein transport protein Sec24A isoform X1 [Nanorana parkeri]
MSSANYNSQNGGSGPPYSNGPVQNPLIYPPVGQNYSTVPGSYPQQIPVKAPSQAVAGLYSYGGPQTIPQAAPLPGNDQGSGQTVSRPHMGTLPVAPPPNTASAPRIPLQNSYGSPSTLGSSVPQVTQATQPNWQYFPTPLSHAQSLANHAPSTTGMVPGSPSMLANSKPPTTQQYGPPFGGPPLQNSFMSPGPTSPPMSQCEPVRPRLGPPPTSSPSLTRHSAPPSGPHVSTPPVPPLISAPPRGDDPALPPTSDSTSVQNSYDTIEGGGFMGMVHPAQPPPPQHPKITRNAYPTLPPGYQNAFPPGGPAVTPATQRYPTPPQPMPQPTLGMNNLVSSVGGLSLHQAKQLDELRAVNLLQERNILPPTPLKAPAPCLQEDIHKLNCSPELFRCTLTNIPQTQALLNKAKLPLGLLLHPFKDLSQLPVVTSSTIVRCRSCRTYINPFVTFLDQRRWKCNLCYRVNDVPEEFMYNPVTRAYGEPHKRPEVQNATIEFMAPSEYMLRPPQPPVYLFMFDVSHNAMETGYLNTVCQTLLDNLEWLPGNTRTKIAFITYDSTIHFYSLQEGLSQPQMLVVSDIDDVFIPMPENLLVNLNECKELVQDLLKNLPQMFTKSSETQSALGPALQAAYKLISPTGGRITVFQTQLPTIGAGALKPREEPNQKSNAKDIHNLTPATDFYKKLALDCSGQQVAVDLFLLSGRYSDLASLGCISRYSAGSIYYYHGYHYRHNPVQVEKLQKELKRYLTRKIGFEAVMRIRCTKGLSIHTFHGNFFVRSTDLLSLPNVNPDAGYAVQMSVEENLTDTPLVSFQSALLYTSSKGERRIRVHTMCLPIVSALSDVYAGADVQAVIGLLANMAVDRSVASSLSDARDALVNAAIDSLSAYRSSVLTVQQPGLLAPHSLCLFPMFVLALLKQKAFQTGTNASLDERTYAMCQIKSQPLIYLMLMTHPNLYRVDNLSDEGAFNINDKTIPQPPILQLSVERLNRDGAYLMDAGTNMLLWVGRNCGQHFITQVLGVANYSALTEESTQLPELDTPESSRLMAFISWLREQRPFFPTLHIIRDESPLKSTFLQNMIEDRTESALSYYEFLLHLQQQVNK